MKRTLFGLVWIVVLPAVGLFALALCAGVVALLTEPGITAERAEIVASQTVDRYSTWVFVGGIAVAAAGSILGWLPGTKHREPLEDLLLDVVSSADGASARQPAADTTGPPTEAELRAFIGSNEGYYMARWARAVNGRPAWLGFNWAACLCGIFWLLYRRMYWELAVFLGFCIVGLAAFDAAESQAWRVVVPALLILGASGNGLYRWRAARKIMKARAVERHRSARLARIRKAGGTSVVALLIGIVVSIAVSVLPALLRA